jgi:hypothetical protein
MPKIMYASGREVYIAPKELDHTIVRMMNSGVRMMKIKSGNNLFLNSNTMDYIDNSDMIDYISEDKDKLTSVVTLDASVDEKVADMIIIPSEDVKPPESVVQKEIKILEDIMAKGNCKHEPEKLKLLFQMGVKGKRYFNTCTFCGWRSKFIKADSLSDTQISGAEQYVEK